MNSLEILKYIGDWKYYKVQEEWDLIYYLPCYIQKGKYFNEGYIKKILITISKENKIFLWYPLKYYDFLSLHGKQCDSLDQAKHESNSFINKLIKLSVFY